MKSPTCSHRHATYVLLGLAFVAAACGSRAISAPGSDARSERSADDGRGDDGDAPGAPADSGVDQPVDTLPDAAVDQHQEVLPDAAEARPDTPPATPYRALAVATGRYHTCAILDDHRVKCWGCCDSYGQLGLGDKQPRGATAAEMGDALPFVDLGTGRTAKAIAAARYATCVILDDDTVKCWGWSGQTGQPADTTAHGNRGDEPGEMGDALPTLDLGGGNKAKRLAMGYYSSCVERDDGVLRCWSDVTSMGDVATRSGHALRDLQGTSAVLALYDDGRLGSYAPSGQGGPVVDIGPSPAIAIGGSRSRACAALENGMVSCEPAGPTMLSELPVDPTYRAIATAENSFWLCGLNGNGVVVCKTPGVPPWAQPGPVEGSSIIALGQPATAIAGGAFEHVCALLADGGIKCWTWSSTPDPRLLGGTVPPANAGEEWRAIDLGTRPR